LADVGRKECKRDWNQASRSQGAANRLIKLFPIKLRLRIPWFQYRR